MSGSTASTKEIIPNLSRSLQPGTNFPIKQELKPVCGPQIQGDVHSYFRILEEREENARKIWNKIRVEIDKRRSGKIKTYFPVMRIKTIMKLDPDVGPVSRDAAAAISFIAELFIHELSSLSWVETENRRMTVIGRVDIHQAIRNFDHFDFLADVVPFWKCYQQNSIDRKGRSTSRKGSKLNFKKSHDEKLRLDFHQFSNVASKTAAPTLDFEIPTASDRRNNTDSSASSEVTQQCNSSPINTGSSVARESRLNQNEPVVLSVQQEMNPPVPFSLPNMVTHAPTNHVFTVSLESYQNSTSFENQQTFPAPADSTTHTVDASSQVVRTNPNLWDNRGVTFISSNSQNLSHFQVVSPSVCSPKRKLVQPTRKLVAPPSGEQRILANVVQAKAKRSKKEYTASSSFNKVFPASAPKRKVRSSSKNLKVPKACAKEKLISSYMNNSSILPMFAGDYRTPAPLDAPAQNRMTKYLPSQSVILPSGPNPIPLPQNQLALPTNMAQNIFFVTPSVTQLGDITLSSDQAVQPSFSSRATGTQYTMSQFVEPFSFTNGNCEVEASPSIIISSAQPYNLENNCQHLKLSLSVNEVSCFHCGAIIRSF